jgi:hypothetical protein
VLIKSALMTAAPVMNHSCAARVERTVSNTRVPALPHQTLFSLQTQQPSLLPPLWRCFYSDSAGGWAHGGLPATSSSQLPALQGDIYR